jgi:muramoyltetrapeptide carboxypeptidase LdcA involved in peptidoglycan recycling
MNFIKPTRLAIGDTLAIVSPSWGGPSIFPDIYNSGIEYLKSLGLKIKEYPSSKADAKYIYSNPEFRARDINDAFADDTVNAIISTIGGDDSVRLLPYLDRNIAINNPKILMGYSDTTVLTTFYNNAGIVTFNGPSVMAGFSQAINLFSTTSKTVFI